MSVLNDHPAGKRSLSKLYLLLGFSPIIVSLVLAFIILVFFTNLPPKLPFFYSLPWGDAQLATPKQLLIIPSLVTLIALINLIISYQLHSSQQFFKKTLLLASSIVCILFMVTFIKIVFIFI